MIAPPRLRHGDRIGVVAPSGYVNRRLVLRGARALEEAGFRVRLASHVFDRDGHLAGSDRARLGDLNRMLRSPDIRCVLMARGGFGTMRIASGVDWEAVRRDPKIFAGFSDATFLHLGFARHAGVRTLHGPNLQGLGTSPGDLRRWIAWVNTARPPERLMRLPAPRGLAGTRRVVSGRVQGGNLAVLSAAAGTGFMPRLRGAILVLEEVSEPPYKVDGFLAHLALTGALRGIRGVAIGGFTRCVPRPGRKELSIPRVLGDHLAGLGIPVRSGLPVGHGRDNRPFPLGARAVLAAGRRALEFQEGLVA